MEKWFGFVAIMFLLCSFSSASFFSDLNLTLISPPNGTLNATNPPTLAWENVSENDTLYNVSYQLCYNSTAEYSQTCIINISSTNYTLDEQTESAIITWAVQAYNASNTSDESNFSAQFYFNIGGEQPITPIYYAVPSLDELLEDYTREWQFVILPLFAAGVAYTLSPLLSTAGLIFSTLLFALALVFPESAIFFGGLAITGFVASFLLKMAGR